MPDSQLFSHTAESTAPIPISKFIDANQYSGGNPDATTSLFSGTNASGQPVLFSPFGLSEYTNANFVHRNTIFTDALPQNHKWWSPYPRRSSTNLDTEIVPEVLAAEDGITDQVVYVKKERDGERIDHFLKTTYSGIRSSELLGNSEPMSKILQLDDKVYENYARLLLPRAVGYSASLLDYFFRGKLNVDLTADETDGSVVRVEGTNGSIEKLDGGTLELYGEDSSGIRTQATAVGSTTIVADPGQRLSVSFRLPANAEKFMAVYKGKLGNEIPQDSFVGGVIGKALGRERVEQIFTDFTRWYIRNPQGVFPLPLLKADVDDLQWGDDDNTMVGRSRIGPGQPNKFYSYRLNRLAGATHVPLLADQTVDMQQMQEFSFPMGMSVGTTIDFSHTLPYKQYLLWEKTTNVQNWVPTPTEQDPTGGHYEGAGSQTAYGISLLVDQTATASFNSSIILDENSHIFGPLTAPYTWDIWNIYLTSDGSPLALIHLDLSTGSLGSATFPSRTLGRVGSDGGAPPEIVELPPVQVPFGLPENGPVWMLVDVSTGQTLANTAPPALVVHHERSRVSYGSDPNRQPLMRSMSVLQSNGGPNAGSRYVSASDVPFAVGQQCSEERLNAMNVLAAETVASSSLQNLLTLNRAEIAQIEFPQPADNPGGAINFPVSCGDSQTGAKGFRITVSPGPNFAPNIIQWGLGLVRTAPVAGTEQLVFLMTQAQGAGSKSSLAKLATWVPSEERIIGDPVTFSDRGLHFLLGASDDIGVVGYLGESNFAIQRSRIVDFRAQSLVEIPDLSLFDYSLLEPNYLYNMFDFKFHEKDVSLASTGLPADLFPTATRRLGRYHVLAVR